MQNWFGVDAAVGRQEPKGEAEVPEFIIVSDAVEGIFVDLDGESRREQVEAKLSRRGREILNKGEEIRSPKRKVTRVESEEYEEEEAFVSLRQTTQRKNTHKFAAGVGGAK